jgi:hypothetical protein
MLLTTAIGHKVAGGFEHEVHFGKLWMGDEGRFGYLWSMDSFEGVNQRELLSTVTAAYREIFRPYRNEYGDLDSDLWFKDLQVDYALEVILANFAFVNLTCERILDEPLVLSDFEDSADGESMADYDMGYKLSEDCSQITSFAVREGIEVRLSLSLELFYAHIQYFNISNTGGRRDWFDVNKRLLSSMIGLIELEPSLKDLLDQWGQDIECLDLEDFEDQSFPDAAEWKKVFIDAVLEILEQ